MVCLQCFRWAPALRYPPDSLHCHVLESALAINGIPGFVCCAKGYVVVTGLTDAFSRL